MNTFCLEPQSFLSLCELFDDRDTRLIRRGVECDGQLCLSRDKQDGLNSVPKFSLQVLELKLY